MQRALSCFNQNKPKEYIVNYLFLWLAVCLIKLTYDNMLNKMFYLELVRHVEQDVLCKSSDIVSIMYSWICVVCYLVTNAEYFGKLCNSMWHLI